MTNNVDKKHVSAMRTGGCVYKNKFSLVGFFTSEYHYLFIATMVQGQR